MLDGWMNVVKLFCFTPWRLPPSEFWISLRLRDSIPRWPVLGCYIYRLMDSWAHSHLPRSKIAQWSNTNMTSLKLKHLGTQAQSSSRGSYQEERDNQSRHSWEESLVWFFLHGLLWNAIDSYMAGTLLHTRWLHKEHACQSRSDWGYAGLFSPYRPWNLFWFC